MADYTSPYEFQDAYLIFRTMDTSDSSDYSDFYLRPLQREVYVVLGGCMLCVLLLLLLARYAFWYTRAHRGSRPDVTHWLMADAEIVLAGLFNRCKLTCLDSEWSDNNDDNNNNNKMRMILVEVEMILMLLLMYNCFTMMMMVMMKMVKMITTATIYLFLNVCHNPSGCGFHRFVRNGMITVLVLVLVPSQLLTVVSSMA